ncbi:MAG: hypothetical protein QM648_07520 [Solirubrobacterales bacterium]
MNDRPTYQPPDSIGDPFRADPGDPAPFLTEHDKVPVVPVEPVYVPPADARLGHPPTNTPQFQEQPRYGQFGTPTTPLQQPPLTPDQRFGRIALWSGVASIFLFNIILGPIAMIMGVRAIQRGETKNGRLAILFGALGALIGVALLVLVAEGVIPDLNEMLRDMRQTK